MSTRDLPDALMELGLKRATISRWHSNYLLKPFVSQQALAKTRQEEAHTWLNNNGHGDLIKNIISVNTGKDAN